MKAEDSKRGLAADERNCSFPAPLGRRPHREDLTMDIGEWLRSIDLGQYEATFRDNEIDDEIVRSLTADDLKDLGVTLVGHRRRILTAIAELSAPAAVSLRLRAPSASRLSSKPLRLRPSAAN